MVPEALCCSDARGRYRFVNRSYERWFGLREGSVLGKHYREVLGEAGMRVVRKRVPRVLRGERVHFELAYDFPGVGLRWVSVDYVPSLDERGSVRGFFTLISDLTEHKRMRQRLRDYQAKLRALSDHLARSGEHARRVLAAELNDQVVQSRGNSRAPSEKPLSPRGREVLAMLADGETVKSIAALLRISVKTAETHRARIMEQLGLRSVAALTKYAIREGLSSLEA